MVTANDETALPKRSATPWHKLWAWLDRYQQAMDYDPQVAAVRHLNERLESVSQRLTILERERSSP